MNKDLLVGLGTGLVIGLGAGVLATERYISRKTEDYINAEVLKAREDYARYYAGEDKAKQAIMQAYAEEDVAVPSGKYTPTDAAFSLAKKAKAESEAIITEMNYEGPEESEADVATKNVFEEYDEFQAILGSQDRTNGEPYLIGIEEFLEARAGYGEVTLTYFESDGVLIDESDSSIVDIDDLVGHDHLNKFGINKKDKETIHVCNEKLELKLEITLDKRTYTSAILGIPDEEDAPRPRKKRQEADE